MQDKGAVVIKGRKNGRKPNMRLIIQETHQSRLAYQEAEQPRKCESYKLGRRRHIG